ncbi:MAG: PorV/PorQ family protein, partial [Candidatus Cloacimonadota bacterium]
MKIVKFSVFFVIFCSIVCYAMEWDDGGLPGAFLEYGVSARVIGMGRAFSGLADDANAGYFNPGGLDQIDPKELTFQHGILFEGTTFDYLAYAHPTSTYGTFGATIMMVRTPDIEDITPANSKVGEFGENEFALLLTMSKQIARFLSVGINYKLIYHKISHWGAMGHGADIGFFLFPDNVFSIGVNFQNAVKPSILMESERDIYPLNLRAGMSLKLLDRRLVLASDLGWSEYQSPRFYEGIEYRPWWPIILRAGVDVNHLNVGLGVRKDAELWSIGVDYAFSNHYQSNGLLQPTHTVSLVMNFGGFRAKVIPNKSIFSPLAGGDDNIVWMNLNVATRAPIKKWQLRVKNGRGEIVRLYNAWGNPPTRL